MLKPNLTYLAFDDQKLAAISIPIIALLIPFVFHGFKAKAYSEIVPYQFF